MWQGDRKTKSRGWWAGVGFNVIRGWEEDGGRGGHNQAGDIPKTHGGGGQGSTPPCVMWGGENIQTYSTHNTHSTNNTNNTNQYKSPKAKQNQHAKTNNNKTDKTNKKKTNKAKKKKNNTENKQKRMK